MKIARAGSGKSELDARKSDEPEDGQDDSDTDDDDDDAKMTPATLCKSLSAQVNALLATSNSSVVNDGDDKLKASAQVFLQAAQPEEVPPGVAFIEQGKPSDTIFFLLQGSAVLRSGPAACARHQLGARRCVRGSASGVLLDLCSPHCVAGRGTRMGARMS